jgi:hypothetical protein
MTYTSKTTTEQYKAWLATNPTIAAILKVQKQIMAIARQACSNIITACRSLGRRRKSRSCIWTKSSVKEPTSASAQGFRTVYPDWEENPDQFYQYRCERMRENIEEEIAMEELLCQGKEVLIKGNGRG